MNPLLPVVLALLVLVIVLGLLLVDAYDQRDRARRQGMPKLHAKAQRVRDLKHGRPRDGAA